MPCAQIRWRLDVGIAVTIFNNNELSFFNEEEVHAGVGEI